MPRTEEEKLQWRIDQIRTTNAGLSNEIEMLGGNVDLSTARVEIFAAFLVEAGVLTELQRLTEQFAWEKSLKPQLVTMRDAVKERRRQQAEQLQAQAERRQALRQMQEDREKKPPQEGPKLILP